MNNPNQSTNLGSEAAGKKFMVPLIILGVAIIGFCFYLVSRAMTDRYTFKPKTYFTEVFDDSVASVRNLKGDGIISSTEDKWIYCHKVGELKLKDRASYKGKESPELARRWFIKKFPESKGVQNAQRDNLKLISRTNNSTSHIWSRWYLYNWRTDEHYFREWGY